MSLPAITPPTHAPTFASAPRIHRALTASAERRLLEALARRAPHWLTSDQLTTLGFLAQLAAGLSFALSRTHGLALLAVIACIILNWLGDSLDGTLARVRHQQRPRFGFYVDHMADVFGSLALMLGLGCSGIVHWPIAIAMLLGFLVLACESFLATHTLARFELSQALFGPTEIRLLLIAGTLAVFLRGPVSSVLGHRILLFDLGGSIASVCMFAMALILTARHTRELFLQEPLA